jgi:hypothetical protein
MQIFEKKIVLVENYYIKRLKVVWIDVFGMSELASLKRIRKFELRLETVLIEDLQWLIF